MMPERSAGVDADHYVVVNWEVFFFSTPALKARFAANPIEHCGLLTDPVSKMRFHPTPQSPQVDYNGRPYFFSSDSTAAVFRSDPGPLGDPSYPMAMKTMD